MSLRQNAGTVELSRQFVEELTALHQRRGIRAKAELGKLVLEHCCDGAVDTWLTHRANKDLGLRHLAQLTGCPCGKSALHQAVRVYLVCLEDPEVLSFTHLGPSHIVATLTLSRPQRGSLLRIAEHQRFSVQQLRTEVARQKAESPKGQSMLQQRQQEPQVLSAIRSLEQARQQVQTSLTALVDQGVGPDDLHELLDAIFALESLCADLRKRVKQSSITVPPPAFSSTVELAPHSELPGAPFTVARLRAWELG